jgi:hypothetical protein
VTSRTDEVLETLRSLVKFDMRALFDGNNSLLPPSLWPQEAALAITSIVSREIWSGSGQDRTLVGIEHKLRLSDRIKAVELALKELGMLTDRQPPTNPDDMTDQQIAHVLYEVVSSRVPAGWEHKTDEEIDRDFARIVAAYDERRPGIREHATKSPPAVVRMLPAPPRLPPPDFQPGPAPAPSAAPADMPLAVPEADPRPEADDEPELLPWDAPPPPNSADRRLSDYERQVRAGHNIVGWVGAPSITPFWKK